MPSIDDVYGPNLLHWQPFDETKMWRPCAECERALTLDEIAVILVPPPPFEKSDLRACLCSRCDTLWHWPP